MLERYCDTLVIGTELPGLITAAFLARRGLSVHLLDLDPFAGASHTPDPFCVAHLHSKLLRSILGRLNVPEPNINLLKETDSPLQVIFPKKRIDISPNPIIFYEELEREFPKHIDQLKIFYENLAHIKHQVDTQQLYSHLLPKTFMAKRKLKKFLQVHDLNKKATDLGFKDTPPDLSAFLKAQLKLLTYTHNEDPFVFQVAELLNPNEGEILSVQAGHQHLKQIFLDRIAHHDGVLRSNVKIDHLLFRNGLFHGAKLAGNDGNILSRYIIWNTQLKPLLPYLPKLMRFWWLKKAIREVKPKAHWFTTQFEIDYTLIPLPMKENILYVHNPNSELSGTNFLYIQLYKRAAQESQKTVISVSYLLAPGYLDEKLKIFEGFHAKIKEILEFLIPFSQKSLELVFPLPHKASEEETLFPLREDDFEVFKQNAATHPVYEVKTKTFADLFPISYKTPSPNFFLTSPEILGGLGYEGKYMMGLKVTDLIWSEVEREKKRAMKVEQRIA
ncbi:MAG: hypothetical protein A3G32_01835 [Deltaproteobacteria bacterium RIFCSPLOWO2_12_FULL_40_28]|nr:MAG: hypothetical protein A3C45_06580 [Deltaproteobacteria bacterium RIFCSPHIGHO2_02_FULL_40_28]OGQ18871.1 MAG: hypothetical protein A3E27_09215 [Deltaproteobacteria bacterium RIFCSPHIGHO2_12_FULL_40_32]OGQ40116.1 MAG: hypothetical protein A3I69_01745 [Deltaproteobacteria bacterium RIFCSPLOWO2_02_FULL_40_36]OGQ53299.1 MAG: hypothetical protein A3G32_01835 [Deltaproteobacteria bacterium RIFCSPLOWO2_12_FULL_40_28]